MEKNVLLTGGGSGGHVFPLLAVAEVLRERGWGVSFAGTATGLEARLVPESGVDFHPLRSRPVSGHSIGGRLLAGVTIVASAAAAWSLLGRLGARAVVATGGYVSVPAGLAAFARRRPLVLIEPNARAGMANRWLSRGATVAAIADAGAEADLRCRVRVTGVPVRRAFFDEAVPLPERAPGEARRLLVLGGSQGAQSLNELLPSALRQATDLGTASFEVLHQAGAGRAAGTGNAYSELGVAAEVVEFLDDVPAAMAEADLVIGRAGAITLAEISAAGRPALLFPLPGVASHQLENARVLERAGAARVFETPDAAAVATVLDDLIRSARLAGMAAAARRLAAPRAAAAIADLVEEVAG